MAMSRDNQRPVYNPVTAECKRWLEAHMDEVVKNLGVAGTLEKIATHVDDVFAAESPQSDGEHEGFVHAMRADINAVGSPRKYFKFSHPGQPNFYMAGQANESDTYAYQSPALLTKVEAWLKLKGVENATPIMAKQLLMMNVLEGIFGRVSYNISSTAMADDSNLINIAGVAGSSATDALAQYDQMSSLPVKIRKDADGNILLTRNMSYLRAAPLSDNEYYSGKEYGCVTIEMTAALKWDDQQQKFSLADMPRPVTYKVVEHPFIENLANKPAVQDFFNQPLGAKHPLKRQLARATNAAPRFVFDKALRRRINHFSAIAAQANTGREVCNVLEHADQLKVDIAAYNDGPRQRRAAGLVTSVLGFFGGAAFAAMAFAELPFLSALIVPAVPVFAVGMIVLAVASLLAAVYSANGTLKLPSVDGKVHPLSADDSSLRGDDTSASISSQKTPSPPPTPPNSPKR